MSEAKFTIGQIVHHQLFDYRGVIFDVDYKFLSSEQWYSQIARSRPPKDQPWYHVLVDGSVHQTYVAERNLGVSTEKAAIEHPLLAVYFKELQGEIYQLKNQNN